MRQPSPPNSASSAPGSTNTATSCTPSGSAMDQSPGSGSMCPPCAQHSPRRTSPSRAHTEALSGEAVEHLLAVGLAGRAVQRQRSARYLPCDLGAPREPYRTCPWMRFRTSRGLLLALLVDLGAEIAHAHVQPTQEPHHGMPAHPTAPVLDLGHVRDVDPRSRGQRFLG